MGMYDHLNCKYPLPNIKAQGRSFQTKDTPDQFLANYEIREDGTLWVEMFTIRQEINSDAPLGFYIHRENLEWKFLDKFTGEIRFYDFCDFEDEKWVHFSSYFIDGKIQSLVELKK